MQRLQPTRLPKPGESHERRGRQTVKLAASDTEVSRQNA